MSPTRPTTPPRSLRSAESVGTVVLTPEKLRRIEINRLKAKEKLRAHQAARAAAAASSSAPNSNGKRPLEVVPSTSKEPTAPAAPPPLKPDFRMGRYFEYDLSKMVNSKGGFLVEDGADPQAEEKRREKERERQRQQQQKFDTPMYLDADRNPKCAECNSMDIDQTFKKVFGCLVCNKCKNEIPEKYSLLTKTECKEDYLLTDPELRDHEAMPHLLKANPHKSTWNNMMLFLRFQVEAFAFKKWGSPEALDVEFERRTEEKRKKKNKKFEEGLRELRRKTREGVWQRRRDEEHQHQFGVIDTDEGVQRCTECGFEIEVEEL